MLLGVNIDHVATLREARKGIEPDPLMAAPLAILGGADGITAHLREDRRHINDRDLLLLSEIVPVELNLEMAATREMIAIAADVNPDMVTLVPEKRAELTTEGGLDVIKNKRQLKEAVKKLHKSKIPVSLFINPDRKSIDAAHEIDADMVELHTGMYANAEGNKQLAELKKLYDAAEYASNLGIMVNAGHGLNYVNVQAVAAIDGIRALYIGHGIISRAVLVGMERAVSEMKSLISKHSSR